MRIRSKRSLAFGLAAGAALLAAGVASAQDGQFITIGTGGVTGVYYPAGGAICRLVNADRQEHGIRCSVESTGGSVYNVNTMRQGELDFGIVQSDVQYNALEGLGAEFEGQGPFEDLRAVFALHPEPFTLLARADSGIATFDDLQGQRVNVSNPGSGSRATFEVLMDAKGWTMDDFALASELKSAEQSQALADNNVDAIAFIVGHPNGSIQEATTTVDANLIPVSGPEVDALVEANPYFSKAVIPGGMYPGNPDDTETFGVRGTLVTTAGVSDEAVYQVVKAVFENFEDFKKLHPAFAKLEKEAMISAGLSAPLHPGAIRYYQEAGLM
ncbi:MAG: TAXI family TRAP transporter solute-binding subunit [Geminicoccaceae bacterium]